VQNLRFVVASVDQVTHGLGRDALRIAFSPHAGNLSRPACLRQVFDLLGIT